MIRKDPIPKLDVIGQLSILAENATGNYVESKMQEKYFIKAPIWDIPLNSIELLAINIESDYLKMLQMQEEMLDGDKRQRIINKNRIKEMYSIQKHLRERFIVVSNFLKDCENKKSTAVRRVAEEKSIQFKLKQSKKKYQQDIRELRIFHEVLSKTVKKFEPYETVIEKVVEESDMYKSVKDCMARCDALMLTQVEIGELQHEKILSIEEMRKNMVKVTNDAALAVLGMNNDLAELERSYIRAQTECLKWEKIIAATKDTIVENELNKDRLLDAIQQMYRLLSRRKGSELEFYRFAIEQQLDFIKDEIEILQVVIKRCSETER